ncbi:hypothetical protein AAMO2058_000284600 [Amorphochlora amoebiformis]|mmetsp:Transcript_21497/g.33949  ORF Transcript_21497/g.33949 Transcript_21497/m.33949 type:complete len:144 (-) Transcript_21497:139-570(-)
MTKPRETRKAIKTSSMRLSSRGIQRADFCSDFILLSDSALVSILDSGEATREGAPSLRSPYSRWRYIQDDSYGSLTSHESRSPSFESPSLLSRRKNYERMACELPMREIIGRMRHEAKRKKNEFFGSRIARSKRNMGKMKLNM